MPQDTHDVRELMVSVRSQYCDLLRQATTAVIIKVGVDSGATRSKDGEIRLDPSSPLGQAAHEFATKMFPQYAIKMVDCIFADVEEEFDHDRAACRPLTKAAANCPAKKPDAGA